MDSSASSPSLLATQVQSIPAGHVMTQAWCAAAAALLRVSTKECEALARAFEAAETADAARLVILDLLASAGTVEAQIVMRRLLALAVARRDRRCFAAMIQRLGFLQRPDGPTLRFLMSVYAEARSEPPDVWAACAYALGAAAGRVRINGDEAVATRACDVLRRDLRAARSSREVCALLAALGNAGLDVDASAILRFGADPDASVRATCALALRHVASAVVRRELLAMIPDPDPRVGQSALSALAEAELTEEEVDRVGELVLQGRTALGHDARILALLQAQRAGRGRNVENALRQLLGRLSAFSQVTRPSGEHAAVIATPTPVKDADPPTVRVPLTSMPVDAVPPFSAEYEILSARTADLALDGVGANAIQTLASALPRGPALRESGAVPRYVGVDVDVAAANARKRG